MHRYYPVFLDIKDRLCVVVGGGQVAERKVTSLLEHGAAVRVVSPEVTGGLHLLTKHGNIMLEQRRYKRGDSSGAALVIAATDDPALNGEVAREARETNIPVNVVDDPERSTFIVPSMLHRGDVQIAISTSGRSPALARKIRTTMEKSFPEELAQLAVILSEVRQELRSKEIALSAEDWQDILDLNELLDMLKKGRSTETKDLILQRLSAKPNRSTGSEARACNL